MNSNIIQTIKEMFSQRGYTNILQDNFYITATKPNNEIVIAFTDIIQKLNVTEVQNCIAELQKRNINHGLVVFEGIPTSVVKVIISNIEELQINIELFNTSDLQFNITKHILVPNHESLSDTEITEIKTKYGTNIPVLLRSDPVCKFYNFLKGEIIKVTRRDGFVSFRIVK